MFAIPFAVVFAVLAAPAPAVRIEGQVKDPAGKPVEKALVLARPEAVGRLARTLTTRSDGTGAFSLALDGPGDYIVRVEAAGLAPVTLDHVAAPRAGLAVTLRKGASIEGVVKDARGKPVANARVEARPRRGIMTGADPDAGRVRTATDARGAFTLAGLETAPHVVAASARGLGGARRDGVMPGQRLELLLVPGADVVGTVRGPDGKPLPGATVMLRSEVPLFGARLTERTDERGAFEFLNAAPGPSRVLAWRQGLAPAVVKIAVVKNMGQSVALKLEPASRVTGRLVDAEGRPQRGALVLQEVEGLDVSNTLGESLRTESDEKGRFTIDGMPRAALALAVTAPGFVARRVDAAPVDPLLDLGDVTLDRGATIAGRVVDGDGRPIAGAKVRASLMGNQWRTFLEGTVESGGRFVIAGAEPGLYDLRADAEGYAGTDVQVSGGERSVEVVLQRAGSIVGTVVDETGVVVPAFDVAAVPAGDGPGAQYDEGAFGRLALDDVPAGEWKVQVVAGDKGTALVTGVKVAQGKSTELGRVRVTAGGAVRGRVTDAAGSPVAGAHVWAEQPRGAIRMFGGPGGTYTDGAGGFMLRVGAAGSADLVASHPDFSTGRLGGIEVERGRPGAEVHIVLVRGGTIEGVVRRRDGRALEPMQVMVRPLGKYPGSNMAAVGADGTFTVEHLPAGAVMLNLTAGTGEGSSAGVSRRQVIVEEGGTTSVEFVLREMAVSGTVTRRGEPAGGMGVAFMGGEFFRFSTVSTGVPAMPAGPQRGWALTRPDGGYELLVSDPGTYTVSITSGDGRSTYASRQVQVPDADTAAFDFTLGGTAVSGRAKDAETGRPVQVSVNANPEGGRNGQRPGDAVAGTDGRFTMELDPGQYVLTATAAACAPDVVHITVGDGPVDDVQFSLGRGARIAGRVVGADGRPAGRLMVGVFPAKADGTFDSSRNTRIEEAEGDGTFVFEHLAGGSYVLNTGDEQLGFTRATGVAAGTTNVVLRLAPGGRVRATVLSPDGAPVAGAGVTVRNVDGFPWGIFRGGTTDASGTMEMAAPLGRLDVSAADGRQHGLSQVTVAAGETATVSITLQRR